MDREIQLKLDKLHIGRLLSSPVRVYGGLLHRMLKVETESGTYAVKVLNPTIMKRPRVQAKLEMSEGIVRKAKEAGLPAVCAIESKCCVHRIGKQAYMVFPWKEAEAITADQADEDQCRQIGAILARLHCMAFSFAEGTYKKETVFAPVAWDDLLEKAGHNADLIESRMCQLEAWDQRAVQAAGTVLVHHVISHRDLDCKNVLWDQARHPLVIDWEAAGWVNPAAELVETACYWSGVEINAFDEEKFKALIKGYQDAGGTLDADWDAILDFGFRNKLEWLAYNYRRVFGIEASDHEEKVLARREVEESFDGLLAYEDLIPRIRTLLS